MTRLFPIGLILLFLTHITSSQGQPDPDLIRQMQRNVCAIKISGAGDSDMTVGCGVVLMLKVDGRQTYFIATANHIVNRLFVEEGSKAEITVFDKSGVMLAAEAVGKEHILYRNSHLDAALLLLPDKLEPIEEVPDTYVRPEPAHLKLISEPVWAQDIYLFGYRWMNGDVFLDILKKGILSVGTTVLPGYEGHLVYLIDNMANKGMSGGLAFTADGKGIGVISSYVNEAGSSIQKSDDLTVCLPLAFYFNLLENIIEKDKARLK